jgi:putative ABC transport system ATP-binding protein
LELLGLARHYPGPEGPVRALDGVSLGVSPGELVGILGPSGSGKSTLLLLAGLLEAPSAGEVRIAGELVSMPGVTTAALRARRRGRVGFVFQKANLIPFLTAAENVAIALEIAGSHPAAARAAALRLLGEVGVAHRAAALPSRLSGGEQQRVAVARAIAAEPPLLLADEPTAALDAARGQRVIELFRGIAERQGAAVLVVTHDPRTIRLLDRVVELEDGRIAAARRADHASPDPSPRR